MNVIARKDEEIFTGHPRISKSNRHHGSIKRASHWIYFSVREDAKTARDGWKLGEIEIEYDDEDDDYQEVILEFHFYDTLIKVISYKTNKPNVKNEAYITNYS